MEAKKVVMSSLLIVLFGIAFISFMVSFGNENDAAINVEDDSRVNQLRENLNGTVYDYNDEDSTLQNKANETTTAFDEDDTSGSNIIGEFIVSAILGVGKIIMGVVGTISDAIMAPLLNLLLPNSPGIRSVVGVVLTSMVLFGVVLVTWRLIKTGG